jgi:hypothetical protein
MDLAVLLPIAAFIALAAGLAVVLRGTARIVARTREMERFRVDVTDLAARAEVSLAGAASQIDAVRRHQSSPDAIGETLAAATDAVERYTDEARALGGPRVARALRADLVAELERAGRALGMVQHGTSVLAASRSPSDLEAQTSIKRGYLDLLHAREAIARHALEAADVEAREPPRTVPPRHT